jgi:hypothetical protein
VRPHNVRLEPPITCDCRYEFTHKVRIPLKRRTSLLSHTAAIVSPVIPHPQGPRVPQGMDHRELALICF